MNSREQILAKRVAALEARLQASMVVIDHLIKDLEFTESVGAAFAFEAGQKLANPENYDLDDITLSEVRTRLYDRWDEAVKALEEAQFAAGRRRGKTEMTMAAMGLQEESGK